MRSVKFAIKSSNVILQKRRGELIREKKAEKESHGHQCRTFKVSSTALLMLRQFIFRFFSSTFATSAVADQEITRAIGKYVQDVARSSFAALLYT